MRAVHPCQPPWRDTTRRCPTVRQCDYHYGRSDVRANGPWRLRVHRRLRFGLFLRALAGPAQGPGRTATRWPAGPRRRREGSGHRPLPIQRPVTHRDRTSRRCRRHPSAEGYCSAADDRQRACFELDGEESLVPCGSHNVLGGARIAGATELCGGRPLSAYWTLVPPCTPLLWALSQAQALADTAIALSWLAPEEGSTR